jgi:dTDP-glucose pyrophosphorylase/CBS domain-containing protein
VFTLFNTVQEFFLRKTVFDRSLFCVFKESLIRQAITCIDQNSKGVALIIDDQGHLIGTITDGDIRRAILDGVKLDAPVSEMLALKKDPSYLKPITAPLGMHRSALMQLMKVHLVRQIPLLDECGRVAGLMVLDDLLPERSLPLQAVIMAGGYGTRLRPLTEDMPKPMLPVGDRPLLERMIDQLRESGIYKINISTHYKPEKITQHFGDGSKFGVQLNYVSEPLPLGTAGALAALKDIEDPLLVINGDILTGVDFRAMMIYHQEHQADLTVAVRQYDIQVPYGVIECDGPLVKKIEEKPLYNFFINAGMYLLNSQVCNYIPAGKHFDMTDLIQTLMDRDRKVISFPIREYWLDIGQTADYEQAQKDIIKEKL